MPERLFEELAQVAEADARAIAEAPEITAGQVAEAAVIYGCASDELRCYLTLYQRQVEGEHVRLRALARLLADQPADADPEGGGDAP